MLKNEVGKGLDKLLRHRTKTGICETCGSVMETHSKCEACGILIGQGHLNIWPLRYRGYDLCRGCIDHWERLDWEVGKRTTFKAFAEHFSLEYHRLRWEVSKW